MVFSNNKIISDTKKIFSNFRDNGIITINDLVDDQIIKEIKRKLSIEYKDINKVDAMKLHKAGILELIFNEKIKYLINLLMPDGILWHCHYIKTPSNQSKPWFNPETRYGSWHKDRTIDYNHNRIDFLDIMIYLSDVGENDGAYAFLPIRPDKEIEIDKSKKSSKIIGPSSLGILSRVDWWHTATSNTGFKDREMLRLSLAKNMYHQKIQESEDYINLRNHYNDKDKFLNFIFGGDREWTKNSTQPKQRKIDNIIFNIPTLNYKFSKSYKYIIKNRIKSLINR